MYFGSYDGFVYALNADGSLKWKYETGDTVRSSPAIADDGTVYIGSWTGSLYALQSDGSLKWSYAAGDRFESHPVIGTDGTIYVGNRDANLYAINADGTLKWRYQTGGTVPGASAVGSDGVVYVGSYDNYVYAINTDGTLRWRYQTSSDIYGSVTLGYDGTVYIGSKDFSLYALTSSSSGLAGSTWPMYGKDAKHTRRIGGGDVVVTVPAVSTSGVSSITYESATVSGNVISDGGADVTARGICYGTSSSPTNCTAASAGGTGSFNVALSGLNAETTYYVRAYATNSVGTAYGDDVCFTTAAGSTATVPTVTTSNASSVTSSSATIGGNVTEDGGADVTERGICAGTSTAPTNCTADSGTGTGAFEVSISGLTASTKYYARAYAVNSVGTAYGADISFTTDAEAVITAPSVSTTEATSVTSNSASAGGNVTGDGGATVTARGVCYNTSGSPTTADSCTASGTGTGGYSALLSNLEPETTYYYRAYATNSAGTSFGSQKPLTTQAGPRANEDWALYWRNLVNGKTLVQYFDGITPSRLAFSLTVTNQDWQPLGYAQFYMNGSPDVYWRNLVSGQAMLDLLEGNVHKEFVSMALFPLSWEPQAFGDFDGDGDADIMWRNVNTGGIIVQLHNGVEHEQFLSFMELRNLEWQIVSAGDFDGDGTDDLVFRHVSNGNNAFITVQNAQFKGVKRFQAQPNNAFEIRATADVDGDGDTDIVWHNQANGKVFAGIMNGMEFETYVYLEEVGTVWAARGAATMENTVK